MKNLARASACSSRGTSSSPVWRLWLLYCTQPAAHTRCFASCRYCLQYRGTPCNRTVKGRHSADQFSAELSTSLDGSLRATHTDCRQTDNTDDRHGANSKHPNGSLVQMQTLHMQIILRAIMGMTNACLEHALQCFKLHLT